MKALFYVWIFSVGIVIGIMFGSVLQCHDDKIKIDSLSANLADTLKREGNEKKRADECTVNYNECVSSNTITSDQLALCIEVSKIK
jgi:hypothetical protein